jgi:hypothetical protein
MTAIFIANLPQFKNALNVTKENLEKAVSIGLLQAAIQVESLAKRNANTGNHKRGEPRVEGGGAGPNVVTGNLRNNIKAQPVPLIQKPSTRARSNKALLGGKVAYPILILIQRLRNLLKTVKSTVYSKTP